MAKNNCQLRIKRPKQVIKKSYNFFYFASCHLKSPRKARFIKFAKQGRDYGSEPQLIQERKIINQDRLFEVRDFDVAVVGEAGK